jgi:hypothetical protein
VEGDELSLSMTGIVPMGIAGVRSWMQGIEILVGGLFVFPFAFWPHKALPSYEA